MVSMSEFLSGFSYHGEPVIRQGTIDPTRRREGQRPIGQFFGGRETPFGDIISGLDRKSGGELGRLGEFGLDPSDFVFGGPEVFARLLQTGELDGGFLSDLQQNRQFAGETTGLMGLFGRAGEQRARAAAAANLNPIFAQQIGRAHV